MQKRNKNKTTQGSGIKNYKIVRHGHERLFKVLKRFETGYLQKIEVSLLWVAGGCVREPGPILDGRLGSAEGTSDGSRGGPTVPVRALGDDVLLAEVETGESEVVGAQGRVRVHHVAEVAGDTAVVADAVLRLTAEVTAEGAHAGGELLEDDSLSLDVADLLGDDPLGHLLQDEETLLDDRDGLSVADELGILLDDGLREGGTAEVVGAVEVVEPGHRGEPSPVVEGVGSAGIEILRLVGKGGRDDGADESSGGKNLENLGEHF